MESSSSHYAAIGALPIKTHFVAALFPALIGAIVSFSCHRAEAQSWRKPAAAVEDATKKADSKKSARWTLADWMLQKQRNGMMDLWLGMYQPSPYEFILSGSYDSYDFKIDNPISRASYKSGQGSAAFFALILGVEGKYENNATQGYQDAQGLVHLRILGNSNQSTHVNLSYGMRRHSEFGIELQQQIAGGEIDLYVEKHIGLHGLYHHDLAAEEPVLGRTEGRKLEAGAFIDLSFVRIFGNWFEDSLNSELAGVKTKRDRGGMQYGLKFYF